MKNQKGIANSTIIIILAIAIVVIGAAWFWYTSTDETSNTNTTVNTTANTNTTLNANTTTNINAVANVNTVTNVNTATNVNTVSNTNTVTTTSSCAEDTSDWLTYANEWYDYTLQYPTGWIYEETDISASESATGWPFRYVTFQNPGSDYSLAVGVRLVGEDIGIVPRTGMGAGDIVTGDTVSIGSTSVTPYYHVVDGVTDIILYYESTADAPVINGHDIVVELTGPLGVNLDEAAEYQTANNILCTFQFIE